MQNTIEQIAGLVWWINANQNRDNQDATNRTYDMKIEGQEIWVGLQNKNHLPFGAPETHPYDWESKDPDMLLYHLNETKKTKLKFQNHLREVG